MCPCSWLVSPAYSSGQDLSPGRRRTRHRQPPSGTGIARALERAGVAASPHQLRHTFGTELYRLTHDLGLTQDLMGHSSPGTTARYTSWSRDDAMAAVAALGSERLLRAV